MSLNIRIIKILFGMTLSAHAMEIDRGPVTVQTELANHDRPILVAQGTLDISRRGIGSLQGINAIPDIQTVRSIDASYNWLTLEGLLAERLPEGITSIDLSYNGLTEFPAKFIEQLPETVTYVNLAHNNIEDSGEDFSVSQRGLRINLAHNRLRVAKLDIIAVRITRPNLTFNIMQQWVRYISDPLSKATKTSYWLSAGLGYIMAKKYIDSNPASTLSRLTKVLQNGLYAMEAFHAIKGQVKTSPELALGASALFITTSPFIAYDTFALVGGHAGVHSTMKHAIESFYMHGITACMRAFGTLYAAGRCLMGLKNKVAHICNGYLNKKRNHVVGDYQDPR